MKPFTTGKQAGLVAFHPKGGAVKTYWDRSKKVQKRGVRRARRRFDKQESLP